MWYQQSTGVQRDSLAQRAWYQGYQGYQGAPTHSQWYQRLNMWVLGCRETHWHRAWYQGYRGVPTHSQWYQRLSMWYQQSTGVQRDSLAQRAWYQGYRGVPTHRVSGTKDSTCGTCLPGVPRGTNT